MERIDSERRLLGFSVGVLGLIFVPITLFYFGVVPFGWRIPALFVLLAAAIVIAIAQRLTLRELGIRLDNVAESIAWSSTATVFIVVFMLIIFPQNLFDPPKIKPLGISYLAALFGLAIAEESIFRGFLFAAMDRYKILGQAKQISLSALISSYPYILHRSWTLLLLAFALGTIWGAIYYRHRNVIGVALGHAIVAVAAASYGITQGLL